MKFAAICPPGGIRLAWALTAIAVAVAADAGDIAPPSPREVEIATPHGFQLPAHLYGRGDAWVIFCHGAAFHKESWGPLCREAAAQGFTALAFDFHAWQDPALRLIPLSEDILAAVHFARGKGAKSIALVGGSMGAGAMLRAAGSLEPGEVDRYVFLSPPLLDIPLPFPGHKQFIASRDEKTAPGLESWAHRFDPQAEVVLLPGGAHAQHIFQTDSGAKLTELILSFLGRPAAPSSLSEQR